MRQNTPMMEAMKAKSMTLRQLSLQTEMKPVECQVDHKLLDAALDPEECWKEEEDTFEDGFREYLEKYIL